MNNLAEAIARDLKKMLPLTLQLQSEEGLAFLIEDTMKRELEITDPLHSDPSDKGNLTRKMVDTAFGVIAGGKRDGI